LKPWLQKKTKEYDGKAKIVAVDADRAGDVLEAYGVNAMPTFVMIKNGKEVGRIIGGNKEKITSLLEENTKPDTL